MRMNQVLTAIGLTLLTSGAALGQSAATKIAPEKGWLNDWKAAQALSAKTGKPIMLVFRCDP
jgi:hypothetical protein